MKLKKLLPFIMGISVIISGFPGGAAQQTQKESMLRTGEDLIYQSDFSSVESVDQLKEWSFECKNNQTAQASLDNGRLVWTKTSSAAGTYGESMIAKLNLEQIVEGVVHKDFYGKYKMEVILTPQVQKDAVMGFLIPKGTGSDKAFSMCLQQSGANIYVSSGSYDKVYSGTVWNQKRSYVFYIDTNAGTASMTVDGSSTDGSGGHVYAYGQNGPFRGLYLSLKDNQNAGDRLIIDSVKVYELENAQPEPVSKLEDALLKLEVPDAADKSFPLPKEVDGVPITWSSNNNGVISIIKTVDSAIANVKRPYTEDQLVTLTATVLDGSYQLERRWDVLVSYDRELLLPENILKRCAAAVQNSYYNPTKNIAPYCITEDMNLLTSVQDSISGQSCSVSWESSDTGVISNTGQVTMGPEETTVQLKAVLTYSNEHTQELTLPVTVLPAGYEFAPEGTEWAYDYQKEDAALENWHVYQGKDIGEDITAHRMYLDPDKGAVLHGDTQADEIMTAMLSFPCNIKQRQETGSLEERLTSVRCGNINGIFDMEIEAAFQISPDSQATIDLLPNFSLKVKNDTVFLNAAYKKGQKILREDLKLYENAKDFHFLQFLYNAEEDVIDVYIDGIKAQLMDSEGDPVQVLASSYSVSYLRINLPKPQEDQICIRRCRFKKVQSGTQEMSKAEAIVHKFFQEAQITDFCENPEAVETPIIIQPTQRIGSGSLAMFVQTKVYGEGFRMTDDGTQILPVPGETDREFYISQYASIRGRGATKYFYFTVKGQALCYKGTFTNSETAGDSVLQPLQPGQTVYAHIQANVEADTPRQLCVIAAQYQEERLIDVSVSRFVHEAGSGFDTYLPVSVGNGDSVKVMVWDADTMEPLMEIPMEAEIQK